MNEVNSNLTILVQQIINSCRNKAVIYICCTSCVFFYSVLEYEKQSRREGGYELESVSICTDDF